MSKLEGRWWKAHRRPTSQEKEEIGALDVWAMVLQSDPGLNFGVQQPPDYPPLASVSSLENGDLTPTSCGCH